MSISDWFIPLIIAGVCLYALTKRVAVFDLFTEGVKDGLRTCADIFPSLFVLVVAVGMFSSSGGLDFLERLIAPTAARFGFPPEITPLLILRPFSGSGSVALFEKILDDSGADSFAGRLASVMLGSSETTFYTIAVYFAATKVRRTGRVLPPAVFGDVCGFVLSVTAVRLMFGAGGL
ncbi:spore maturation protein [Clostridia bacterium]|nr:spore maturation protein [Clostridia bacterium]